MNFKGIILTVVSFLLVAVSCSVEDDAYMNDVNKEMAAASEEYAYVAFNMGMQTKSSASEQNGNTTIANTETISNVTFFLFENGKVVGSATAGEGNAYQTARILTKANGAKKVFAIVNLSAETQTRLLSYATENEVRTAALNASDMNNLVKVGEGSVQVIDGVASTPSKYEEGEYPTTTASITVAQRTARIEISKLSVFYADGCTKYPVTLTGISLKNQNLAGQVEGVAAIANYNSENTQSINQTKDFSNESVEFEEASNKYFYTFANKTSVDDDMTALVLHFSINGKTFDREIKIKHINENKVEAGFIYRLTINAKVQSNEVESAVDCHILDWNYNEIDLGDIYAK